MMNIDGPEGECLQSGFFLPVIHDDGRVQKKVNLPCNNSAAPSHTPAARPGSYPKIGLMSNHFMESIHMAAPSLEIQIYAPFPHAVALGANLDVDPTNWRWVHCLNFPLETLYKLQFSHRPYKWIRYATGAVTGTQGDLSLSHDSLDIVDYDGGLPSESVVLYYHTSDEERRRMFPVDPDSGRINITSSVATSRRAQFRSDVLQWDGGGCILTNNITAKYCDAVHLVAHTKGDEVC